MRVLLDTNILLRMATLKAADSELARRYQADGEGFEPPVPCGTAVFKTAAIVHSATHPIAFSKGLKLFSH